MSMLLTRKIIYVETLSVSVGTAKQTEHADLVYRLTSEPILTANYFERHPAPCLVVERSHYLTEITTSQHLHYFVPVNAHHTVI